MILRLVIASIVLFLLVNGSIRYIEVVWKTYDDESLRDFLVSFMVTADIVFTYAIFIWAGAVKTA